MKITNFYKTNKYQLNNNNNNNNKINININKIEIIIITKNIINNSS